MCFLGAMAKRVAVILAGCGVYDGTEIHEASAILVHLSRAGAKVMQDWHPHTKHIMYWFPSAEYDFQSLASYSTSYCEFYISHNMYIKPKLSRVLKFEPFCKGVE